ncbi:thioredoxin-like protein [Achlya hypogyna]|uniref:Sulfhydryl oxidase n=1 Tax=Achlya hypogyna TaxID=1202772 RepID=A0A0A7CN51_ACHHY|nr:secreted protein [Achlya hypogyna]OQR84947.1 thioredoxin-like protein [Achlya hypogyna]
MQRVFVGLATAVVGASAAAAPLFASDHANVTSFTDTTFAEMQERPGPWIVDFYHPLCSHCIEYASEVSRIAAHFTPQQTLRVGAVNCLEWKELCDAEHIDGYPALVYYNFRGQGQNYVDAEAMPLADVMLIVKKLFMNISPADPPVAAPLTLLSEPESPATRLHDATATFLYSLHHLVFFDTSLLRSGGVAALADWVALAVDALPHVPVAGLHASLLDRLTLDADEWRQLLREWGADLDDGTTYRACASYNCGLWHLLHRASLSGDARLLPVLREFLRKFGRCGPCRSFEARFNSENELAELATAAEPDAALTLHVWRMHNAANEFVAGHTVWPPVESCATCRTPAGDWNEAAVLAHLRAAYTVDQEASLRSATPTPPLQALAALSGAALCAVGYMYRCRRRSKAH